MKKLIIAAAIVLAYVSGADAEMLKCEIVQVFPGFFLPRCENYDRHEYRNHYWSDYGRWEHERNHRHDRYAKNHSRHDRDYYGKKRHPHLDRDIHDRPYRRDGYRW